MPEQRKRSGVGEVGRIVTQGLAGVGGVVLVAYLLWGGHPDPKFPVTIKAEDVRPYRHPYSEAALQQPSGPVIPAGTRVVAHCVDIDDVKPPHTSIYITNGQVDSYVRAYQLHGNSDSQPTPTFNISLSGLKQQLPLC